MVFSSCQTYEKLSLITFEIFFIKDYYFLDTCRVVPLIFKTCKMLQKKEMSIVISLKKVPGNSVDCFLGFLKSQHGMRP